jgi:hypothetical protein
MLIDVQVSRYELKCVFPIGVAMGPFGHTLQLISGDLYINQHCLPILSPPLSNTNVFEFVILCENLKRSEIVMKRGINPVAKLVSWSLNQMLCLTTQIDHSQSNLTVNSTKQNSQPIYGYNNM